MVMLLLTQQCQSENSWWNIQFLPFHSPTFHLTYPLLTFFYSLNSNLPLREEDFRQWKTSSLMLQMTWRRYHKNHLNSVSKSRKGGRRGALLHKGTVLKGIILYNVGVPDHFWSPVVHVTPLKTPFGLLIPLLQSSPTHNYSHSQLFLTLCHIYTAYNHTRSWLQTLITLLHWLTSQISITFSNYHRLYEYIFTLRSSRRDLTLRIHLLRLLLKIAT
jgi:hypothetical protein